MEDAGPDNDKDGPVGGSFEDWGSDAEDGDDGLNKDKSKDENGVDEDDNKSKDGSDKNKPSDDGGAGDGAEKNGDDESTEESHTEAPDDFDSADESGASGGVSDDADNDGEFSAGSCGNGPDDGAEGKEDGNNEFGDGKVDDDGMDKDDKDDDNCDGNEDDCDGAGGAVVADGFDDDKYGDAADGAGCADGSERRKKDGDGEIGEIDEENTPSGFVSRCDGDEGKNLSADDVSGKAACHSNDGDDSLGLAEDERAELSGDNSVKWPEGVVKNGAGDAGIAADEDLEDAKDGAFFSVAGRVRERGLDTRAEIDDVVEGSADSGPERDDGTLSDPFLCFVLFWLFESVGDWQEAIGDDDKARSGDSDDVDLDAGHKGNEAEEFDNVSGAMSFAAGDGAEDCGLIAGGSGGTVRTL